MIPGRDVSYWNGVTAHTFDGATFALIQCTVGEGVDPHYVPNMAILATFPEKVRCAYHYMEFGPGPTRQAQTFLQWNRKAEILALDAEPRGSNGILEHGEVIRATAIDIRHLDTLHRRIMLYSSPGYTVLLDGRERAIFEAFPPGEVFDGLWVARWGTVPPEQDWTFWQTGGTKADFDQYRGDLAELYKLAGRP